MFLNEARSLINFKATGRRLSSEDSNGDSKTEENAP
jgi:hypothetical protein